MSLEKTHRVFIPNFYNLGIRGNDEIQLIVEVERLDGQIIKVVFHQKRLAGAQIIQQHLQKQIKTTISSSSSIWISTNK